MKPATPQASLLITSGADEGTQIHIFDSLVIGRECRGIDALRCYVIDDDRVSRTHVELHLDADQDQAWVIDRSTNGTRVNGRRIERLVPVPIRPGDRLAIGRELFEFQSPRFGTRSSTDAFQTVKNVQLTELAMVVGDILSFSTISEYTADGVVMEDIDRLYAGLRSELGASGGTLSNYVGDAFFATWEIDSIPDAITKAVSFALTATERVRSIASTLALRDPQGLPIRMGWSVAVGPAAVSSITGMLVSVLGDVTNVAFRLSGIAGRDGWSEVVVTEAVYNQTKDSFSYSEPVSVSVKGRSSVVTVYSTNPNDAQEPQ
jgi:adenylate cyclase